MPYLRKARGAENEGIPGRKHENGLTDFDQYHTFPRCRCMADALHSCSTVTNFGAPVFPFYQPGIAMKHSVSLGIALGAVVLTSTTALAKTVVVPTQYPTIREALRQVEFGDTIFVKPGVYSENVRLTQGVILQGEDKNTTILDGGRRGPTVLGEAQAEIFGFTIRNGIDGILCENTTPKIHDNIIMDNHGSGIGAYISQPHIKNNIIYGNRWSGIMLYGVNAQNVWGENNVIVRNGYSGVSALGPGSVNLRNNIMVGNHEYGVIIDDDMRSNLKSNNIWHNYYPFNSNAKVDRTNKSMDPLFVSISPYSLDASCQKESPMQGAGENGVSIGLWDGTSAPTPSYSTPAATNAESPAVAPPSYSAPSPAAPSGAAGKSSKSKSSK